MTLKSILLAVVFAVTAPNWAIAQNVDKTKTLSSKTALNRIKDFSQARTGGGAIDGGGNDGLDMQSRPSTKGDIVVQIPGAVIGHYGYLRIESTAEGASTAAFISRCDVDSRGNLKSFSCFDSWKDLNDPSKSRSKVDLNESHKVVVGTYLIYYRDSAKFVNVQEDKTTLITLTRIQVPQTQEGIRFKVFSDYTNSYMQGLLQKQALYVRNFLQFSSHGKFCISLGEDGYKENLPYYQFLKDGSVSKPALCEGRGRFTYHNLSRDYVGSVENEKSDSAYVLPGVYGIEFLNPHTGEVVSQYGIVAK